MSTPADRIRRALGFCHRRFWSQKIKDAIKDAAAALAELERERDELSAQLGNLLAVIHSDGGHYQNAHGTAKAVDDAIRIVAERNAKLDDYERAPMVAIVAADYSDESAWNYVSQECAEWDLPPVGTQLIARPTRKDGE